MSLLRSNRTPIGLDLAGREIKAIQLTRTATGHRVDAALVLPQPEGAALDATRAKWLADVLTRQGFRGHRVVCAAPVGRVEAEMLELPPRASGAPVEQIARGELASVARITDGFEMSCWDIPAPPRGGAGTSVFAVALRHDDADALLDPLESAGLEVRAIDARACALARAVTASQPADDPNPHILLDLEWDSGFVILVHRGVVLSQRALTEVGLGALYRGVAAQFDLTEEVTDFLLTHAIGPEVDNTPDSIGARTTTSSQRARVAGLVAQYAASLTEELEQSFAFARHRYPDLAPRGLLVSGAGARVVGLCEQLTGRLRADVTTLVPTSGRLTCADALAETCRNPALTTALGLALHEETKQRE